MIDDKDKKIINELVEDSRQSFRDIARKLSLSTVTVMKRVKRLEKERILGQYHAIVDYEKAGYDVDVLINIKISHGNYPQVYERMKNNPNILALYDTTGDFDAVIVAKFKNRRLLDTFLKKLQGMQHVERTHTVYILRVLEKKGIQLS